MREYGVPAKKSIFNKSVEVKSPSKQTEINFGEKLNEMASLNIPNLALNPETGKVKNKFSFKTIEK